MLERGAEVRAARGTQAAFGPVAGVGGALVLLVALARTVGLGGTGWLVGLAGALALNLSLARAMRRNRSARLGPADWVTLMRATLAVGVAALTAASFERDPAVVTFVMLASIALALDFVDGWVARRTATESSLGARLDGEVDAFLILALSVAVAPSAGAWVLAIGLMRYAFLAAGWALPWMRAQLPRREWRKTVTASQGVVLVVAASQVAPVTVSRVLLAVALAMLAESFGRDIGWLWRRRRTLPAHVNAPRTRRPAVTAAFSLLALAVVWFALVAPTQPWHLTPGSFLRLPLEGLVVVGSALALPTRGRRLVPWLAGPMVSLLVLLKLLDLGFFTALDRPFDPVEDWTYLSIGAGTLRDTFGSRDADIAVAAAAVVGSTALVIPALAVHRVIRIAARHRGRSLRVVGVLAAVWALCWIFGVQLSGARIASTSAAHLAVVEVRAVQADLRDEARFKAALARPDAYGNIPTSRLLEGLRGKDVLLVFIESYGNTAVEGTPFSPAIDAVVDGGTRALRSRGFSARSGWLTSPTFGGGSWLADSTLQSGMWDNTPGRYRALIASKRSTLASLFRRAGWRTVADMPATHGSWPEGRSFYHYEQVWDRENLGYRGPRFGFSPMPDQYALQQLQKRDLATRHRLPVFSEIFLSSSHEPWARVPPLISWDRIGDGTIFKRLPIDRIGLTDTQKGYATSIEYVLRTLYSFIERYGTDKTVLIVLGDEQPSRVVKQPSGHNVPVAIIAHDQVISRLAGWGWTNGMLPSSTAPVWPESAFRNRFLDAFDH